MYTHPKGTVNPKPLCWDFSKGLCTKGESCTRAHELQTPTTSTTNSGTASPHAGTSVASPGKFRGLCRFFVRGKGCPYGADCKYSHGPMEVDNTVVIGPGHVKSNPTVTPVIDYVAIAKETAKVMEAQRIQDTKDQLYAQMLAGQQHTESHRLHGVNSK